MFCFAEQVLQGFTAPLIGFTTFASLLLLLLLLLLLYRGRQGRQPQAVAQATRVSGGPHHFDSGSVPAAPAPLRLPRQVS